MSRLKALKRARFFVTICKGGALLDKWRTIYPKGYKGGSLLTARENSINCPNCVPACSDTQYSVTNDIATIPNER